MHKVKTFDHLLIKKKEWMSRDGLFAAFILMHSSSPLCFQRKYLMLPTPISYNSSVIISPCVHFSVAFHCFNHVLWFNFAALISMQFSTDTFAINNLLSIYQVVCLPSNDFKNVKPALRKTHSVSLLASFLLYIFFIPHYLGKWFRHCKKGRKKRFFFATTTATKMKPSKVDSQELTGEGIFIITNELYSTVKNFH